MVWFDFSQLTSGIARKGERLFPFQCFEKERDWSKIEEWLDRYTNAELENGEYEIK